MWHAATKVSSSMKSGPQARKPLLGVKAYWAGVIFSKGWRALIRREKSSDRPFLEWTVHRYREVKTLVLRGGLDWLIPNMNYDFPASCHRFGVYDMCF